MFNRVGVVLQTVCSTSPFLNIFLFAAPIITIIIGRYKEGGRGDGRGAKSVTMKKTWRL
jgi:hypothetical protein